MHGRSWSILGVSLSLGAAVLLGEPTQLTAEPRHDHDHEDGWCWPVKARMSASFVTEDCDSVVGFCTVGTVHGRHMNGTTWFSATGLGGGVVGEMSIVTPEAEPSTTWSYSGVLLLETALGTLTMSDVGVFDTYGGGFSEVDRVVGGTDFFAGAQGTLFIYGHAYEDGSGFDSTIRGSLCLPHDESDDD